MREQQQPVRAAAAADERATSASESRAGERAALADERAALANERAALADERAALANERAQTPQCYTHSISYPDFSVTVCRSMQLKRMCE
jgi:hypothetical protein